MRVSGRVFVLLTLMSIIGLASALLVVYKFLLLNQLPPFCTLENSQPLFGATLNCAIVLKSIYSSINILSYHIPLEVLAAVWFVINLLLVTVISFGESTLARRTLNLLFVWRFFGLIIVPYLVYLEFFVLHAICIYCTVMHACILIDFIIVSYFLFSKNAERYLKFEE